ncbi:glycosyltransferase [Alphaproteobacteria bacterium US3C007]|nr:glycosyltransferase [Alphaproteobacteria bacterium US3C007]
MKNLVIICSCVTTSSGVHGGVSTLINEISDNIEGHGVDLQIIALHGISPVNDTNNVTVLQSWEHQSDWNKFIKFIYWIKTSFLLLVHLIQGYRHYRQTPIISTSPGPSCILPFLFNKVFIWENVAFFGKRNSIDSLRLRLFSVFRSTIIVPTESEKEYLNTLFPKLLVVHLRNWVSPKVLRKLDTFVLSSTNEFRLLAAGMLHERKGFDLLLEALSRVDSPIRKRIKVDIYGEGSERENLEGLIDDLSLTSQVSLKGFSENLYASYRYYDCFVLPSRFEGFPLVMLNALYAGLPVIAFDCPTGPGAIINSDNGFLIENGNVQEMAKAFEKIIKTQDHVTFRKACPESVSNFRLDNSITTLLDIVFHCKS